MWTHPQKFTFKKLGVGGLVAPAWLTFIGIRKVEDIQKNQADTQHTTIKAHEQSDEVILKLSISEANKMFTKEELREAMPEIKKMMDEMNEYFPGTKLLYARENGLEIGEPLTGERFHAPCLPPPETKHQKYTRLKMEALRKKKR
jgi:hypothetical protein